MSDLFGGLPPEVAIPSFVIVEEARQIAEHMGPDPVPTIMGALVLGIAIGASDPAAARAIIDTMIPTLDEAPSVMRAELPLASIEGARASLESTSTLLVKRWYKAQRLAKVAARAITALDEEAGKDE
jgi:hypothetical protein